jgi:nitrite reductase/ring-hydroxylating ferredoxin subunit
LAHYRIRLIGGPTLHFAAARCRQEHESLVFEDEQPGGGWKVVCEIHTANIDWMTGRAVPRPPGS